jgi:hypothetical protein
VPATCPEAEAEPCVLGSEAGLEPRAGSGGDAQVEEGGLDGSADLGVCVGAEAFRHNDPANPTGAGRIVGLRRAGDEGWKWLIPHQESHLSAATPALARFQPLEGGPLGVVIRCSGGGESEPSGWSFDALGVVNRSLRGGHSMLWGW